MGNRIIRPKETYSCQRDGSTWEQRCAQTRCFRMPRGRASRVQRLIVEVDDSSVASHVSLVTPGENSSAFTSFHSDDRERWLRIAEGWVVLALTAGQDLSIDEAEVALPEPLQQRA